MSGAYTYHPPKTHKGGRGVIRDQIESWARRRRCRACGKPVYGHGDTCRECLAANADTHEREEV